MYIYLTYVKEYTNLIETNAMTIYTLSTFPLHMKFSMIYLSKEKTSFMMEIFKPIPTNLKTSHCYILLSKLNYDNIYLNDIVNCI